MLLWHRNLQDMITKRGENAGKQAVKDAHARAAREERLVWETEARKAQEEEQKVLAASAAKVNMQDEVNQSRQCQLQLRKKVKQEIAREEAQFVAEVRGNTVSTAMTKTWCLQSS